MTDQRPPMTLAASTAVSASRLKGRWHHIRRGLAGSPSGAPGRMLASRPQAVVVLLSMTKHPVERDVLGDLPFEIRRTFYNYLAFLEDRLARTGLDADIRPGMGPVMIALGRQGDLLIKDLVAVTGLSPSRLTSTLDRMETGGLVQRRTDPDDARATRIRVTTRGQAVLRRLESFHEDLLTRMHAGFRPGEVDVLTDLLRRLNVVMLAAERDGEDGADQPMRPRPAQRQRRKVSSRKP